MQIFPSMTQYLKEDQIIDIDAESKEQVLEALLNVILKSDLVTEKNLIRNAIYAREQLMSTGIGYGIAIPHARHASVKDFVLAVARVKKGVPCDSIDDQPVNLFFMIVASDKQDKDYLRLLSQLMLKLKNHHLLEQIQKAQDTHEIYDLLEKA